MAYAKGQSGNPGGRPRAVQRVRDLVGEHGETLIADLLAIARNPDEKTADRLEATKVLLDRWLGKAPQQLDDGDGGPVRHIIEWLKAVD